MRLIFAIMFLFVLRCNSTQAELPKANIKLALKEINNAITNNTSLHHNPLNFSFDGLASRGYLYFYRAQAFTHMAKTAPNKNELLERALQDLHLARMADTPDKQRVEQAIVDALKEKITVLHREKHYRSLIECIERLPAKEKTDSRHVLLYANALYRTNQIDNFKRLARNYLSLMNDTNIVANHLANIPDWQSVLATLKDSTLVKKAAPSSPPMIMSKDKLLKDPGSALSTLEKSNYFINAEKIFTTSSELYFSIIKKDKPSNIELKFVRQFRRQMLNFSPAFVDSLIFAHWKRLDLKTAELLSTVFLTKYEGHPLYPKVLFNLGRIQEDSKNYSASAKTFKTFLEKSDDITYAELARFRLAWVYYLANKEETAKPFFISYLAQHPEGRYASTSEYVLLSINQRDPRFNHSYAVQNFIKKYPLNLYSYLLVDEHKISDTTIRQIMSESEIDLAKSAQASLDFKADISILNRLQILRELEEFELVDDAINLLKTFKYDANNNGLALHIASRFRSLDFTHGEVSMLINLASNDNVLRELVPWQRLFPTYRLKTIEQEISALGLTISPLLVLALIRQESAFDPNARSTANAYGLMQLTKGTADDVAKILRLKNFSLFKEQDNLRIGIKLFANLLNKFNNRIDYALGAYNAGESATQLWITLRGHLPPTQFVESIPYPETRTYIKGVLRNFAIYRMLYEKENISLVSFNHDAK